MKRIAMVVLASVMLIGICSVPVFAQAKHPSEDLCQLVGRDVVCNPVVYEKINGFQVGTSVPHAATNITGWFCNDETFVTPATLAATKIEYIGGKYVAKNMIGERFHPVLRPADPNNGDCNVVNWARLERLPGMRMKEGIVPTWVDQSEGWNKPCICMGPGCPKKK